MPTEQSFKSHAAMDPPFHFFVLPVLLINVVLSIYITIRDWPVGSHSRLWLVVVSIALFVMASKVRLYALRNQDRLIRLEERLRIASLLPPAQAARAQALTMCQLISLRFASDAELPALVDRTLNENLDPKQIKQSIVTWRPDHHRI